MSLGPSDPMSGLSTHHIVFGGPRGRTPGSGPTYLTHEGFTVRLGAIRPVSRIMDTMPLQVVCLQMADLPVISSTVAPLVWCLLPASRPSQRVHVV